ncbi:hypothetical protein AGR7A_pAt10057 [Agrobacterium deltaense NCPPB 1641]|uniref:Uncharacterized protein n=1 Tax=Agrobacterium deltaense NCPPB 1641 TaxID=1183425 RepID=A0A1S7U7B2_9HYPH|nr:hypothetical protein AGR7A_pAt10057 [Agrobacterium deltaense NCPPB 1641]
MRNRYTKCVGYVAATYAALPKTPKLNELQSLFRPPPQTATFSFHHILQTLSDQYKNYTDYFNLCNKVKTKRDWMRWVLIVKNLQKKSVGGPSDKIYWLDHRYPRCIPPVDFRSALKRCERVV